MFATPAGTTSVSRTWRQSELVTTTRRDAPAQPRIHFSLAPETQPDTATPATLERNLASQPSDRYLRMGSHGRSAIPHAIQSSTRDFPDACASIARAENLMGYFGIWQNIFLKCVSDSLASAAVRQCVNGAQNIKDFPSTLRAMVLQKAITDHQNPLSRYRYDFMLDEIAEATATQPAAYALKPSVAKAIEIFAQKCVIETWPRYAPSQTPSVSRS